MKKLILLTLTIFIFACSSDDDNSSGQNCNDISTDGVEIYENLITTGLAYFVDASVESCNGYKGAIQEYLTYAESIKDCLNSEDQAELEAEIDEFETELAGLDCL